MIKAQTKHHEFSRNILLIGVKTGKCDICKTTKKVLLLKYGFTLCEDCFSICTSILQELQATTTQKQKVRAKLSGKKQETTALQAKSPKRTYSPPDLHLLKSKSFEA